MENRRIINHKLILGGALLGACLLAVMPVFAYDQKNTHPALTDEIVDFYNLSFPDRKITEEEKQWLIKGSVEEDTLERPLYHFYDPVYNRGIAGISSKDWATKDGVQAAYYNGQLTGFAAISGGDSASDFSYQRALRDYAKGDIKRAFVAFGHTLHLLEDAGVPDHTRNDAHPSFIHGQESPYEAEMAKWSPQNFNIARSLFLSREKPVSLDAVEKYFDKIANYSNNHFFSKGTINNKVYLEPSISIIKKLRLSSKENYFVVGIDPRDKKEFPLAFVKTKIIEGKISVLDRSLINNEIKTHILDGYWDRLSKEVVVSGAGALELFLKEAESARREYLVKAEQKKPSFWAQVFSLFGLNDNEQINNAELSTENDITTRSVVNPQEETDSPKPLPVVTQDGDSGDTSGDKKVSPTLSPILSPKPIVSPSVSPKPSPSPSPTPTAKPNSNLKTTGRVIINEIAWAGTEASPNDEWLELYNTENYDINLNGWVLKVEDGTPDVVIEEGKIIKAQSYFLLERTDDTTVNSVPADQIYTGAFGNEGEVLRLTDSTGILVDVVGKTGEKWFAGSSAPKISMERVSASSPGDVASNWKDFTGSPSAKDANGNFVNGTPKTANSQVAYVVTGGGGGGSSPTPTPTPTPSPEPDGDTEETGDTASSGDVVINEIAWMGTTSSVNDEWIELHNTTNETINLTNWTLKSQDGTPDITLTGSIGPLSYYLLERTDDDTLPTISADKIYTGALGNEGENLVLKDVSGTTINQVDGSNGWKLNGDDEIIGDNTNKKTAQRMDSGWITATSTPRAENSADATTQAPSAVTNLAATHSSPTITATWTAPDPGSYNIASLSYDLRYSSTIFSDAASASWGSAATVVASSSLPSVAEEGASQSASFDIAHEYGQTFYFALKVIHITTYDVVSEVSNVATVSFPSAIDDGSWGMFGKDQYHTSLATVAGPGSTATISWEFDVAVEYGSGYNISQSVADSDGNVYFGAANGSSGKIIKLDKNKVKQWEYATNVSIGTPAVLSDGIVYFGRIGAGGALAFTALNSDGSKKWDYDGASKVQSVTISPKGEAHFTYTSGTDKLAVLNPADGSAKSPFPISAPGLAGFAPVVLDDGKIITAARPGNHIFTAYASSGAQLWQVYTSESFNNPLSDPSHDKVSGKTYSAAGPKLFEIPSSGSAVNVYSVAEWNYTAATMVAISSDTLYVGFNSPSSASGSLLYALNKSDLSNKSDLWPFQADGLLNKQLVVDSAGNVYFSTQNGKLYSVDNTGNQRWVINSGSNSTISPALTAHGLVWGYGSKVVLIND